MRTAPGSANGPLMFKVKMATISARFLQFSLVNETDNVAMPA